MAMVVRTNYSALNATRHLNKNQNGVAGSIEKLSSGFKVNRAADDASGLAISEKMKAQIKALETAVTNAEDGIGLIQTTEGYLDSIHSMLNRMVTLAEKSANGIMQTGEVGLGADKAFGANIGITKGGTYDESNSAYINLGGLSQIYQAAMTDRDSLQAEMDQLCAEIDRVASTANFNKVKLFDGNLATKDYDKISTPNTFGVTVKNSADAIKELVGIITDTLQDGSSMTGKDGTTTLEDTYGNFVYGSVTEADAAASAVNSALSDAGYSFKVTYDSFFAQAGQFEGKTLYVLNSFSVIQDKLTEFRKDPSATQLSLGQGLTLQIGETSNAADKLIMNVGRMNTDSLFANLTDFANNDGDKQIRLDVNSACTVKGVIGYTIDISGQQRASAAAEGLNSVINKVSVQRAELGAMQNRLDYTIDNLNTAVENVTASNSRIRDTDMAKEMTKFTMQNVLLQSAQSMLAQANAQPQNVLSLLR